MILYQKNTLNEKLHELTKEFSRLHLKYYKWLHPFNTG